MSSDSVYPSALLSGVTAHDHKGEIITGTIESKAPIPSFNNGRLEIQFNYGLYSGLMHLENISIPVPSSGTNSITIKVPNGTTTPSSSNAEDWISIVISVDSSGNADIYTPTNET